MDELVLTSAADYGTARARKLSRFVVEALDLPSPRPVSRRTAPLEALAREAPAPEPQAGGRDGDPGGRAAAALLPADRRLRDLPAQVPLPARAARAAARAPRRRLRPRGPRGGAQPLRAAARRRDARRRRARRRVPLRLGLGGLPVARARGRAPARGRGDAAPLPRGAGSASPGARSRSSRSSRSRSSATASRAATTWCSRARARP